MVSKGASEGATKGIKKKTRSSTPKMNWATNLYRIKKSVNSDVGIASDAMFVLNAIVEEYKDRMIKESFKIAETLNEGTVKSKHARMAAELKLNGDLLKHTKTEGEKAWAKYKSNK